VIEMSQSSWLAAALVPGVKRQPLKKIDADKDTLLQLLHRGWPECWPGSRPWSWRLLWRTRWLVRSAMLSKGEEYRGSALAVA
jgi:hypothetical protein